MSTFLGGLRRGASHEEAARAAGFSRSAFFRLRRRNADFAALWDEVIEQTAGIRLIVPGTRRQLQLRRNRRVKFTERRRQLCLSHFAATCNLTEAALAAGVSDSTVFAHIAKDPDFAAAIQETLAQGYVRLEAEALRARLEAQRRLREGILPAGEIATEFDRVLKLLQRWDRRGGGVGPRTVSHGKLRRWTFDEAIEALDKKLRALGARRQREGGEGKR